MLRKLTTFKNAQLRDTRIQTRRTQTLKPIFLDETNSKYFNFQSLESNIYNWWDTSGFFKPTPLKSTKQSFVVPMPPPNVTGHLHMGHAVFISLQDIVVRFKRMRQQSTLWLPGTDHAGIATQSVVEKLLESEGVTSKQLGREAFLDRVWQWKNEKGGHISHQMRRMGASADWSKEKFTLEPSMSYSVTEAFVRLHEKGLIYRGEYMVNWSPSLRTAVSDLEVDHCEEAGTLYYFKYMVSDGTDFIPVATTRPETILGDVAVCIHPNDSRYSHLLGKLLKVPGTERTIPVISDGYVDPDFGTGALKITPAHDVNDFLLSKRHNLSAINIMNSDATINHLGGEYVGLDRFVCRERIWRDMVNDGLAIRTEPHIQRIPRSQRGGEIIEPMLSTQWFVDVEQMSRRAMDAVRNKDIVILPERFEKLWYHWLETPRDWCISRQLWWGHRIPVYYVESDSTSYIVARSREEAERIAIQKFGADVILRQDEDVLDTWFSSGLWPFASVGWPLGEAPSVGDVPLTQQQMDYQQFYPASLLETGHDILFFWVARMVMLGLELTDKVPFRTVYLHGLVKDAEGQKMSKSKGNVIDPLVSADQFGCDALRYALVTGSTPGQDISLSTEKMESSRNFAHKLWNAGKYMSNCLDGSKVPSCPRSIHFDEARIGSLPLSERFIISRCHQVTVAMTSALDELRFGEASSLIYNFLWGEFADWYLEISKARLRSEDPNIVRTTREVLLYVWDTSLKLLHPFMPYLTETLWQLLPQEGNSIMISEWPLLEDETDPHVDLVAIKTFSQFQSLVSAVRTARTENGVDVSKKIGFTLKASDTFCAQITAEVDVFCQLARVDKERFNTIFMSNNVENSKSHIHIVVEEAIEGFIPLAGLVDSEKEVLRLEKQRQKLLKDLLLCEGRMSNKAFIERAPDSIVHEERQNLSRLKKQLSLVEACICKLKL